MKQNKFQPTLKKHILPVFILWIIYAILLGCIMGFSIHIIFANMMFGFLLAAVTYLIYLAVKKRRG